jgi:hypothetical protein
MINRLLGVVELVLLVPVGPTGGAEHGDPLVEGHLELADDR